MKLRYLFYAMSVGISLCFLSGCSADDNAVAVERITPLTIGSVSVKANSSESDTRATGSVTVLKEGTVGISCASSSGVKDNVPYTYGASSWTALGGGFLLSETTWTMAAYYPYSENGVYSSGGSNAALNMAICPYEASKDLCVGHFTASATDYAPTPILSHIYARVSFRFVKRLTYKGSGVIRSFMLKDMLVTAEYMLYSNSLIKTISDNYNLNNLTNITANTDNSTIDLLLIPVGVSSGGQAFAFYADGTEPENFYEGTIPRSLFASTGYAFQAGCHYKLKVLLGSDGFVVEPDDDGGFPVVSGWKEVTLNNEKWWI